MLKPEKQIRDKLNLYNNIIERKLGKIEGNKIPIENVPKVQRKIGRNYQNTGMFELVLGDCGNSMSEFEESVEWYSRALEEFRNRRDSPWESEANNVLDLLHSALLSGHTEHREMAAEMALEVPEEFVDRFPTTYRYFYMKALAASILETNEACQYLNSLEKELANLEGTKHTFFEALWLALSGIEQRDDKQFSEGIHQFLNWHDQQVDFENKTSAKDLVCRQAASLLVLARQKGLEVRIDSEYIPECVYELA